MSLRPLEGFVVGITADRRWAEQAELLERRGAAVLHGPTISTEYLGSDDVLRHATDLVIARPPDYLVATTGIGIRAWFEAAQAWDRAQQLVEALEAARVVARGPKAMAAVQVAGLSVWASPPSERLEDVVDLLLAERLDGKVVAFQHYGERNERAVAAIAGRGASVVEVPVYRYRQPAEDTKAAGLVVAVCEGRVDAVTFTSAPAVRNLVAVADLHGRRDELKAAINDGEVVVACIGPVCAGAAREVGFEHAVAPDRGRLGLLVRSLTDALRERRRELRCGSVPLVVQGRAVAVDADVVVLTPRERMVFDLLVQRPGAVVARTTILRSLGSEPKGAHALEATIARLRGRMGEAGPAIRAVRGRGYCLDARVVAS